jgi:hypothetical protein
METLFGTGKYPLDLPGHRRAAANMWRRRIDVPYRLRRRCWYLRHSMGAPSINSRLSSVFTKWTTPS